MAGTGTPEPVPHPETGRRRSGAPWWALVLALAAVAFVAVLLVVRPWLAGSSQTSPTPAPPSLSSASSDASAAPPVVTSTVTPPVATFDAETATRLLLTPVELQAGIPAAAPGVEPGIGAGEFDWGLPDGSTVEPQECTLAVTVVSRQPRSFDARSWFNEDVDVRQETLVLGSEDTARDAFAELVNVLDVCPTYRQVTPGVDGATWTAEPAIEGQGLYPSIVREVTHAAEGDDLPSYQGYLLVGNTIVSWEATSLADVGHEAALATLGNPESLDALVQQRALAAVQSLG